MNESEPAVSRLLRENVAWVEADDLAVGHKRDRELAATLTNPRAVKPGAKAPSPNVRIHEDVAGRLPASSGGRTYLVAITEGEAVMTALLDPRGRAEFVGPCERVRLQEPLERYAKARKVTPGRVLRDIAQDPRGSRARDLESFLSPPAPVAWADQAPDERQFSPEETPQAVLDRLGTVHLHVLLPQAWRAVDQPEVLLCGRTPMAWSECTSQKGSEMAGALEFSVSMVPGTPTSLWLLDRGGKLSAPTGRLIDLGVVADGTTVALKPKPGVSSFADLRERAGAGLDPLTLA